MNKKYFKSGSFLQHGGNEINIIVILIAYDKNWLKGFILCTSPDLSISDYNSTNELNIDYTLGNCVVLITYEYLSNHGFTNMHNFTNLNSLTTVFSLCQLC